MGKINLADLRIEYAKKELNVNQVKADPIEQFEIWFEEAIAAEVPDTNAMTLSTVSADGFPNARMVLLKGIENANFIFFTNYNSRKGKDLEANPYAALTFYWPQLERQININGKVTKLSTSESDAYYHSRPRKSQVGAWASEQSQPINSRQVIISRFAKFALKYLGRQVERPPHWGGFELSPTRIEFWQGRPSRLHDRIQYLREVTGAWKKERLAP